MESAALAWGAALSERDADGLLALLHPDVCFESPFSLWRGREQVGRACTARVAAFSDVQVATVIADEQTAVVRWTGTVPGGRVEGCEVLTGGLGGIHRVDVFLRPASVLRDVRAAMAAAWPE